MYAIIDIETCGGKFNAVNGRITDICILIHNGFEIVEKYSTLINPECYISSFYTKLTGITNEMASEAPKFYEIAKDIWEITENKVFVAHNVSFDYTFVKNEFAALGACYERDTLCTVKLSRKILPGFSSYSLGNLCSYLNITNTARHRAEGDAIATAKLFNLLLAKQSKMPLFGQRNTRK